MRRPCCRPSRIKLAAGAHLLPYHNPVELAHRVAFLDHLAQGRLQLGVGAGGHVGDFMAFDVDGQHGENRAMMIEALTIMMGIWAAEGAYQYEGKYWNVNIPESMVAGNYTHHMHTFTKPHPPIGIAVMTPGSDTIKFCGANGFMPLSIHLNDTYTVGHWETYARSSGSERHHARSQQVADLYRNSGRRYGCRSGEAWPLRGHWAALAANIFGSSSARSGSSSI